MPFAAPASNQTPLFKCCQSSHWGEESRPGGAGEQHHDARRPLLTARTSITTRPDWSRDQFFVVPAAAWTVSLLVSLGLWWGIWSAASSLVSALW
jgi:hypothetical protein